MTDWTNVYDEYDPELQNLHEALCTLGNGYFATRGAAEEATADEINYPGTYIHGGFNRRKTEISGRVIENEDLVNWPNWLVIKFKHDNTDWFNLNDVDVLSYEKILDIKKGILSRTVRFRDDEGRESEIKSKRIVHMDNPHLAAIHWTLTPLNWSGAIKIHSAIDGTVVNGNVERYSDLNGDHLNPLYTREVSDDGILLTVETKQSKIQMAQAARTRVYSDSNAKNLDRSLKQLSGYIAHEFNVDCTENKSIRVEKIVSLYTSKDFGITEASQEAENAINRAGTFDELLQSHVRAWEKNWNRFDIIIRGDSEAQRVLRLHIFHLMQTASKNTIDLDAGIPARGLHGEAYRGHIFWDELFIFPFLNLHIPELARSVKMYRFRRLREAEIAAKEAGYAGAMFPWQSGSNGREESQELHLNPKSGEWVPDNTHLQRHVNHAIAYNIWSYYQATDDMEFMTFYGSKIILKIALFLSSLTEFNEERDRYEIRHVVGPDEFHTQYPDSDKLGLNNNAYTNIMTVWVLKKAMETMTLLDEYRTRELRNDLHIDDSELNRWMDITEKMFVPFHEEHIISQFEGYDDLEEFDWAGYEEKYDDIQRLDRILGAEGDSPNRYKASKQADLVMLFYLFPSEEVVDILQNLGYDFEPEHIPDNINYYLARTSHGSTLSRLVHSWVVARSDRQKSWDLFREALMSDFKDIQGGTTEEGIHLGAMAGTVDLVQRCYTGLSVRNDVLWLDPVLPEEVSCMNLRIRYRGHWIQLEVHQDQLDIEFLRGWSSEVNIGVKGHIHTFKQGESRSFPLQKVPKNKSD
jgi:trehalose/maltose hydrolase-like predicted phosphorylase